MELADSPSHQQDALLERVLERVLESSEDDQRTSFRFNALTHGIPIGLSAAGLYAMVLYYYPEYRGIPFSYRGVAMPSGDGKCWPFSESETTAIDLIPYTLLLLLVASHYVIRSLIKWNWTSYELTEDATAHGMTREHFPRDTAIHVKDFILHSFLGPYALWAAVQCASSSPPAAGLVLFPASPDSVCPCYYHTHVIGRLFLGNVLFQVLGLILGWETGLDTLFHHVLFLILAGMVMYSELMFELSVFGIAMETSTPALCLMLVFRSVQGFDKAATVAGMLFAVLFLASRVFFYGLGIWRSLSFWWTETHLQQLAVEALSQQEVVTLIMQALFTAGWVLQLVWARLIVAKMLRALQN